MNEIILYFFKMHLKSKMFVIKEDSLRKCNRKKKFLGNVLNGSKSFKNGRPIMIIGCN